MKDRQSSSCFLKKYTLDFIYFLLAYTLFLFFKILPLPIASFLGSGLGGFIGLLLTKKNKIAFKNLSIAFPQKNNAEKKRIIKKMWHHFGRVFAEMTHKTPHQNITFHNKDLIEKAIQSKKAVLASAHIGNWENGMQLLAYFFKPIALIYRKANNVFIEKLIFSSRPGLLIPKGEQGGKMILKFLQNNGFLVYMVDQKLNEGDTIAFFGMPAKTATAIPRIALKKHIPIFMLRLIRIKGTHFHYYMEELDFDFEKTSPQELALKINQTLEKWIIQNPEQWLWCHRRFDKSIYK